MAPGLCIEVINRQLGRRIFIRFSNLRALTRRGLFIGNSAEKLNFAPLTLLQMEIPGAPTALQ